MAAGTARGRHGTATRLAVGDTGQASATASSARLPTFKQEEIMVRDRDKLAGAAAAAESTRVLSPVVLL